MPLRASNLSFAYPSGRGRSRPEASPRVLDGVTIEPAPGRLTAVLGPNGAGKTTLLRLMLGLLKPDPGCGEVTLEGRPTASIPEPQRARKLLYLAQRSELPFDYDLRTAVALAAPAAGPAPTAEIVDAALDRLGLLDRAAEPVGRLSVGQRQRAALARVTALAECRPGAVALLADEPFSAQDPRHAGAVADELRAIADRGPAVVVVLHDLTRASRIADDAMLLDHRGRPVASGPASAVITPESLELAFGARFSLGQLGGGPAIVETLA